MPESILYPIIVAAIIALGGGYIGIKVMEVRINGLRETLKKLEAKLEADMSISGLHEIVKRVETRVEQVSQRVHAMSIKVGAVESDQLHMAKEITRMQGR